MSTNKRPLMQEIQSWDEVPAFKTEAEEAEFWATHALGDGILTGMAPAPDHVRPPAGPRIRPIAVRFDQDIIRRLRALAERKHKGYQTLLREFVIERLYEEEKREGLVG